MAPCVQRGAACRLGQISSGQREVIGREREAKSAYASMIPGPHSVRDAKQWTVAAGPKQQRISDNQEQEEEGAKVVLRPCNRHVNTASDHPCVHLLGPLHRSGSRNPWQHQPMLSVSCVRRWIMVGRL